MKSCGCAVVGVGPCYISTVLSYTACRLNSFREALPERKSGYKELAFLLLKHIGTARQERLTMVKRLPYTPRDLAAADGTLVYTCLTIQLRTAPHKAALVEISLLAGCLDSPDEALNSLFTSRALHRCRTGPALAQRVCHHRRPAAGQSAAPGRPRRLQSWLASCLPQTVHCISRCCMCCTWHASHAHAAACACRRSVHVRLHVQAARCGGGAHQSQRHQRSSWRQP